MPGLGPMIEVAVGLALIYLLFASLLSVLFEAMASALSLRSKALENAIVSLIEDPGQAATGPRGFIDMFTGLFGAQIRTRAAPPSGQTGACLSKIVYSHPLISGVSIKDKPSYVPARHFSAALLAAVRGAEVGGLASQVEQGIVKLTGNASLSRALTTIVQDAQGDWDKIKAGVEAWYDSAMDRLSGDYKRFHQVCTFAAGLSLAVACNIDSVAIVQQLYLRSSLTNALNQEAADLSSSNPPVGACAHAGGATAAAAQTDPNACLQADISAVEKARGLLFEGQLPIGWRQAPQVGLKYLSAPHVLSWTPQFIGWVITALAGMLGAPFWFDALQKLVNMRGAGPKSKGAAPGA